MQKMADRNWQWTETLSNRIRVVEGDLEQSHFGLSDDEWDKLTRLFDRRFTLQRKSIECITQGQL